MIETDIRIGYPSEKFWREFCNFLREYFVYHGGRTEQEFDRWVDASIGSACRYDKYSTVKEDKQMMIQVILMFDRPHTVISGWFIGMDNLRNMFKEMVKDPDNYGAIILDNMRNHKNGW